VAISWAGAGLANTMSILAGDADGFHAGDAVDVTFQRHPFDDAIAWEWNNHALHQGVGRPFDRDASNHVFGYSFTGLPINRIDLTAPVWLEMRLQSTQYVGTDHLQFQLRDANMTPGYPGDGWSPPMSWGSLLNAYLTSYMVSGSLLDGVITKVDLRTLTATAGTDAGMSIAESMNLRGYLDVHIEDDTGVDWMRLTFGVPTPSSLALFAVGFVVMLGGLMGRGRSRQGTATSAA
jgi:hypothetical protein